MSAATRAPPLHLDAYFLAALVSIVQCAGYLRADLNRGFFDIQAVIANYVFVVLVRHDTFPAHIAHKFLAISFV